jgi:tRNA nucleotidyltransferase/poly(A) polymerase
MKNRVKQFITELRSIRIYITGKDLEELGVKPGPLYKEIINKIYREKINGKIKTREEELELLRVMIKEKREDEEIV